MRKIAIITCLLLLAACGSKDTKPAAQPEDPGAPQVATSIDDAGLPIDKSDQITSIDAATGDASGMPHDGGAVIQLPKEEPPAAQATAPVPAPAVSPIPAPAPATVASAPVPDAQ
jgi:hypothetical protein